MWMLLVALAFVLQQASPALACSSFPNCRKLASVQPADGATGVARNIELRITYDGVVDDKASVLLEDADGKVVPATWERARTYGGLGTARVTGQLWIGRSTVPLAASTHYRVRHSYSACRASDAGIPPSCDGLCLDPAGEVIAEFTTGASTDEAALSAPALGPVTPAGVDVADDRDSCGPYVRCLHRIDVPPLPSDQRLRVTRGDELVGYFEYTGELVAAVPFSGRFFPHGVTFLSDGGEYQASVVDAIGNRSAATTFVLPACVIVDAGVTDAGPDASAAVDASGSRPDASAALDSGAGENDDGYTLAGRGEGALWLALALVLVRARRA